MSEPFQVPFGKNVPPVRWSGSHMPARPAFSTEDASLLSSERDMLGGRRIEMRIPSDCRRGGVAERGSSVSSSHGSDLNRGTSDNGVMNGKLHEHSMRGVAILSVLAGAVFLAACGSGAIPRRQPEPGATQPVALHHSPSTPATPKPTPTATPTPTPSPTPTSSVQAITTTPSPSPSPQNTPVSVVQGVSTPNTGSGMTLFAGIILVLSGALVMLTQNRRRFH